MDFRSDAAVSLRYFLYKRMLSLSSSDKQGVRPDQAIMQQLLSSLQSHPQSWAFLQPVNGEEVTDYYDVIKKPMGKVF